MQNDSKAEIVTILGVHAFAAVLVTFAIWTMKTEREYTVYTDGARAVAVVFDCGDPRAFTSAGKSYGNARHIDGQWYLRNDAGNFVLLSETGRMTKTMPRGDGEVMANVAMAYVAETEKALAEKLKERIVEREPAPARTSVAPADVETAGK
jgi:hypothetical protein